MHAPFWIPLTANELIQPSHHSPITASTVLCCFLVFSPSVRDLVWSSVCLTERKGGIRRLFDWTDSPCYSWRVSRTICSRETKVKWSQRGWDPVQVLWQGGHKAQVWRGPFPSQITLPWLRWAKTPGRAWGFLARVWSSCSNSSVNVSPSLAPPSLPHHPPHLPLWCQHVALPLVPPRMPQGLVVLTLTSSLLLWFLLQLARAQPLQAWWGVGPACRAGEVRVLVRDLGVEIVILFWKVALKPRNAATPMIRSSILAAHAPPPPPIPHPAALPQDIPVAMHCCHQVTSPQKRQTGWVTGALIIITTQVYRCASVFLFSSVRPHLSVNCQTKAEVHFAANVNFPAVQQWTLWDGPALCHYCCWIFPMLAFVLVKLSYYSRHAHTCRVYIERCTPRSG